MASFGHTDEEFDPGTKLPVLNPGFVLFISSVTLSELFNIFSYSVKWIIMVPASWIVPRIK